MSTMKKLFRLLLLWLAAFSLTSILCAWNIVLNKYTGKTFEQRLPNKHNGLVKTKTNGAFIPINPCSSIPAVGVQYITGWRSTKCIRKQEPYMLTGECPSRLGNQMFSYAVLFAVSRYNNRIAYMSPSMSDHISKYFNVSLSTIDKTLYKNIQWNSKRLGGKVPYSIRKINKPYVKFFGVPQVWAYFDEIRAEVVKEFRFYDHIILKSKTELFNIKNKFLGESSKVHSIMVGIHIRRGDYLVHADYSKFHLPTIEFYKGAIRYFQERYKNVIFVVASNDIKWCMENLTVLAHDLQIHILKAIPEEDGGLDLAILSHCDHMIFGLGTFGWWASYLVPGEVVFCSDCITSRTSWLRDKLIYNGDYSNFVLPNWIGYTRNGTQSSVVAKTKHFIKQNNLTQSETI